MALPKIKINALNLAQGVPTDVENLFAFIGEGEANTGQILRLNGDSDLDVELGNADSEIKRNVAAARLNAGQNWNAVVLPVDAEARWQDAVDALIAAHIVVEAIVICTPIEAQKELDDMQTAVIDIWNTHGIRLFMIAGAAAIDGDAETGQTWGEYATALGDLTDSVSAEVITITPYIFPDSVGVYAGRLSNSATKIADSPMRVATGAVVGKSLTSYPTDKNGVRYNNAHAKALNDYRYSVPYKFLEYPGIYWSDGTTLDAPTGDYSVIENLRVVFRIVRLIRPILISMIGDRAVNSTPIGQAFVKNKLTVPLLAESKSTTFFGKQYPGNIKPPADDAITQTWTGLNKFEVYLKVQPYECPKEITANIIIDLTPPA